MSAPELWHTAKETAELLGIGRTRLRVSGMPHVRVGRRCYYLRSDIEAHRPSFEVNGRAAFCRQAFTVYTRWTDEDGQSRALSDHPLYGTWRGMMDRCYVGHDRDNWHRYGGRGIGVYKPWQDLPTFIHDIETLLGPRPLDKTLDRIEIDGDYEPGNVWWASDAEQARNRGSVLARVFCFCRFDCSWLPGVCEFESVPWRVLREYADELLRRIEAAREAPLPPLVRHVHTGAHDDCWACLHQDPFRIGLGDEINPHEHCAAAAGYSHRHLAPLGVLGL